MSPEGMYLEQLRHPVPRLLASVSKHSPLLKSKKLRLHKHPRRTWSAANRGTLIFLPWMFFLLNIH